MRSRNISPISRLRLKLQYSDALSTVPGKRGRRTSVSPVRAEKAFCSCTGKLYAKSLKRQWSKNSRKRSIFLQKSTSKKNVKRKKKQHCYRWCMPQVLTCGIFYYG